jgi:hypothetical protein
LGFPRVDDESLFFNPPSMVRPYVVKCGICKEDYSQSFRTDSSRILKEIRFSFSIKGLKKGRAK